MFSWLQHRRRRRWLAEPFPAAWLGILDRHVKQARRLPADLVAKWQQRMQVFVRATTWEGCRGFEITDEVRVTIAGYACLLALGFEDEVWWSRLAQPEQHGWTDAEATPKLQELTPPTADPDPKALACYGLLVRPQPQQAEQMWLRFVTGRPVSAVTIACLAWCCAQLAAQGFTALLLIWDNASWHTSGEVRGWLKAHNRAVNGRGRECGWGSVTCRARVRG